MIKVFGIIRKKKHASIMKYVLKFCIMSDTEKLVWNVLLLVVITNTANTTNVGTTAFQPFAIALFL